MVCNNFSFVLLQLLINLVLTSCGLCHILRNVNAANVDVFPEPIMGDEPTPAELMDEEYYMYRGQGMVISVRRKPGASL